MNVQVDPDRCQGHTLCNMAAPDVFHLRDEDGHAYVAVTEFTPEIIAAAKRAAAPAPSRPSPSWSDVVGRGRATLTQLRKPRARRQSAGTNTGRWKSPPASASMRARTRMPIATSSGSMSTILPGSRSPGCSARSTIATA